MHNFNNVFSLRYHFPHLHCYYITNEIGKTLNYKRLSQLELTSLNIQI